MILTSLIALAFSLSSTNISVAATDTYIGGVKVSRDNSVTYNANKSFSTSTGDYIGNFKVSLNYDSNYNEYASLNYDVNFGDGYCYFSCDSIIFNNYNVYACCGFTLVDSNFNTIASWSFSSLLGDGVRGGDGFGGDSDVINVTFSSEQSYTLYCALQFDLVRDLDLSSSEDYESGYNNGYTDGFDDGKTEGTNTGYDNGYDVGYDNGYSTGHTTGYQDGYNTALSGHSFSFTNLFASISDTPILMIRRLFGFEIFGTSVMAIFMSLFTALVIIKIFKKVL